MSWYPSYQYSTRSPGAYTGGYANPGQSNQNYAGLPSYLTNSSLWKNYDYGSRQAIADTYAAGGTIQGIPGAASAGGGLTANQNWQNQFNQLMGQAPTYTPTPTPGQSNAMLGPGATSKSYDVIGNGQPTQFGGPNPPSYATPTPSATIGPGGVIGGPLPSQPTYGIYGANKPPGYTGGPFSYNPSDPYGYGAGVPYGAGGVPGTMSDPGLNKTGPGGIQYPTSPGAVAAGGRVAVAT